MPTSLLYAIATRVGGPGLPTTAAQGIQAAAELNFLGGVIALQNRQKKVAPTVFHTPATFFPRLAAKVFLGKQADTGMRKLLTARAAAKKLRSGKFDMFHSWSGDCLEALIESRRRNIPSLIEIPTWHRNKFIDKPFYTKSERQADDSLRERLRISRQHILTEYALADVILVQSQCAADSFLAAGIPAEKLLLVYRGVDPHRFTISERPRDKFRLVFLGALIKRKGVHHILEAWHRLNLPNAELILIGNVGPDIHPYLQKISTPSVTVTGFVSNPQDYLRTASAFVFPSELEGSAKATFEAAGSGLAQITTRESGDAVEDGVTGTVIPANDPDALTTAIKLYYDNPDLVARMGDNARQRILNGFTWDHHRQRLLHAYAYAREVVHQRTQGLKSAS